MSHPHTPPYRRYRQLAVCLIGLLGSFGCGGIPSSDQPAASVPETVSAQTTTATLNYEAPAGALANSIVTEPTYHLAAVFPPPPPQEGDASMQPQVSLIPAALRNEPTARLRVDEIEVSAKAADPGVTPQAALTYSPAQIRAAYGLPPVPATMTGLTAAQLAQFGAGQTIYIVDAYHDLCAYSELTAFSQRFGLPACTNATLAANATLPLAAASATAGASFYQVYATASGSLTSTAPAYNANWAVETALDVQWAHAIAPLARIVLIEAADATLSSMSGAIQLANRMGPGVVSMSFGTNEASFVTSLDSYFKVSGMSYFAATGDNGPGVSWPAVSSCVVAVGGTSLTFSGNGTRSETVWSGTGGGVSAYAPRPAYQASTVPGLGTPVRRSVADVAFNANPNTGQYIAVIQNQASGANFLPVSWVTAGGTSLSTPQWAALTAVANSIRAQAGKPALGDPHSALYADVGSVPANYSTCFLDITSGSNGATAANTARAGYDAPTGLGTPQGLALLTRLAGLALTPIPPAVTGANITVQVGQPLSFTAALASTNPCALSLTGAPSGMTINSSAVINWPTPTLGTYNVTVVAKDTVTGLTGQGNYSIQVLNPPAPMVSTGAVSGLVGTPLGFNVTVTASNAYTLSLSGAPSGMTIGTAGNVTWPTPVAGSYTVTVNAKDTKTGLTGQGAYTVSISTKTASPPVLSSGAFQAKVGTALKFTVVVNDPNACAMSLTGAPGGMTIDSAGTVTWSSPVTGSYTVTAVAKDTKTGLTGQGTYALTVGTAAGPVITATPLLGVPGQPLKGTLTVTNGGAPLMSLGISGLPAGLTFTPQAGGINILAVSWVSPVAGKYPLTVQAMDSAGNRGTAVLPLTVATP